MRSAGRSTLGPVTDPEADSLPEPASDSLPVLSDAATVLPALPGRSQLSTGRGSAIVAIPAVQAAAVAAGGFVAGAAVVGLAQRRSRNTAAAVRAGRSRRFLGRRGKDQSAGKAAELLQIVGSRSLLVDVHLLGAPPLRPGR